MATYKEASDGPPYIIRGYPLASDGEEETRFCSYRVLGRAEQLFRLAGFRDGQQIRKELFYALAINGDITNNHLEEHPPTICSIPQNVLGLVEEFNDSDEYTRLLSIPGILQAPHVLDLYRIILQHIPGLKRKQDIVLFFASLFFLARRLREHIAAEAFKRRMSHA